MSSSLTARSISVGLFCLLLNLSAAGAEAINGAADAINGAADTIVQVTFAEKIKARIAAENILKQLDDATQNPAILANVYEFGGNALKNRYSTDAFVNRIGKVRGSLGSVKTREFDSISGGFSSLPNIPGGLYVIAVFNTTFEHAVGTYTEQVTLEKSAASDGSWKYVEYYTAPKKPAPSQ